MPTVFWGKDKGGGGVKTGRVKEEMIKQNKERMLCFPSNNYWLGVTVAVRGVIVKPFLQVSFLPFPESCRLARLSWVFR